MADFGQPVAQNVQTPDFSKTLSGLMGLQQQKLGLQQQGLAIQAGEQGLQQGAQQLQVGANAAQGATQEMSERAAVTNMLKTGLDDLGNKVTKPDGEHDLATLLPALGRMAPMTGQKYAQSILGTQTARTALQTAGLSLGAQQRAAIMGPLQAIATNPGDPKMVDMASAAIDQWGQQHPEMAPVVSSAHDLMEHVKSAQDPATRAHLAQSLSAMFQGGQQVQTQPQGATVNTGANTLVGSTAPPVAGGGFTPVSAVQQQVAPGMAVVQGADANLYAVNPQNPGAPPVKIGGDAAGMSYPAGESANTKTELETQRTAAQQAANSAPTMHNLNRGVIQEVDKGITTGSLGALIQKIRGATGFTAGADEATDYNTLGKLLERSAIASAQAAGPHTNAGLEAQVRANGSTDYSPAAIRKIAALNDAAVTGSTLYHNGLEKAVTQGGSVFAKRQFDQQWASAMNPANGVDGVQALRFKNAVDSGDARERAAIIGEVGGAGSKGAKALLQKLQQIHSLAGQQ